MLTAVIRTVDRNSLWILLLSATAGIARSLFFWPYGDAGICAEFRTRSEGPASMSLVLPVGFSGVDTGRDASDFTSRVFRSGESKT